MRKAVALAAVAALALAAAPAGSAKGPTLKSLQAQIKSLQKQVTTLKKRVTTAEDIAVVSLAYAGCSDTFAGLDGYFGAHALPAYFGAQAVLNDYQTCQAFSIVRAHNQSPPNTNVLRAVLDLFKPTSSAAHESRATIAGQARHALRELLVLFR
jgi:hypothetical protein